METWTVYFANVKLPYHFEKINKLDTRLLELRHFITCLPPEIPRDISFIPSILEPVQRWWVSLIRSITSSYWRSFIYSSCLSFIFHSSIHPSPQLYIHRSSVPSFFHSTFEFGSMISLNQSLYGQVFKPRCSFHSSPHKVKGTNFFFKSCSLYLRPILWQTVIFAWELARHVISGRQSH